MEREQISLKLFLRAIADVIHVIDIDVISTTDIIVIVVVTVVEGGLLGPRGLLEGVLEVVV